MRPEECFRLKWESVTWVNDRNGAMLVTHGKTAVLALLALPAPAQKSNIRADNNPDVVESVKKFELELCDLIVHGEWDAYASRLTDDYIRILPGKIQTKKKC